MIININKGSLRFLKVPQGSLRLIKVLRGSLKCLVWAAHKNLCSACLWDVMNKYHLNVLELGFQFVPRLTRAQRPGKKVGKNKVKDQFKSLASKALDEWNVVNIKKEWIFFRSDSISTVNPEMSPNYFSKSPSILWNCKYNNMNTWQNMKTIF